MTPQVRLIHYHYIVLDDETSDEAPVVNALTEAGVNLLAFSEFPHSPGKSQLDLVPEDAGLLQAAARHLGLELSAQKSGFLIEGDGQSGAVAGILEQLARAGIPVTALHTISTGSGKFGALLWVKPPDVETAANVLGASAAAPADRRDWPRRKSA